MSAQESGERTLTRQTPMWSSLSVGTITVLAENVAYFAFFQLDTPPESSPYRLHVRKFFHLVVSLVTTSGLLYDRQQTLLASIAVACAFIVIGRYCF